MARVVNLKEMICEAIGLSNMAFDRENRKMYSVQFYDFDFPEGEIPYKDTLLPLYDIFDIFPYDCIGYLTKHGIHLISFALFETTSYTKAQAVGKTMELGTQDYWCSQRDLILRISPKWKRKRKALKVISDKPKFFAFYSKPSGCLISKNHLEFYRKFMDLPDEVYNAYKECPSMKLDLKLYFYNARD